MANFSLDEWGTPVIGGAISVWGDMGANNILGGKTVLFNLNPRKVLSEVVYGSHPTLVVDVVRYMGEIAGCADVRRIEIAASAIEVVSLTEASIQAAVQKVCAEIASLGEFIHKDVHVSIPVHVATVGDTYVRGILTGAEEVCMIADSRMVSDIQVIKSEVAGIGDVFASATTRVFNEGLRIRDVINNSFIPILSGIDEWGNPVIGIMTPLGDVIHANISGGKDFVIRKTSWMELIEIVSLLQTHTSRVTKVFSEIAIAADARVSEVAKVPFDEVMYVVDTYIPVVEAIRAEVVSVIEGARQTIVERYLAEVPIMVDVVNRRFLRYVSEVFIVIDARRLYPRKYVKEVVEVLDSKVYTATHFMHEVIQAVEDKKVTFYLVDVVGLVDTYVINMRRVFSEVTTYADSYYRTQFLYEVISAKEDMYTMFWKYMLESISIADYYRNLFIKTEVIEAADSYLKAATHYISDTFTPHDRTVRRNPLHYISDRVCATDLSIKYYITRPLVELIAGVDTVLKRVSKTHTEKTTLYDTRGRTTAIRYLSDIISATDNLIGRSFAILTEKIYAADTYSRQALTTIKEKLKFKDSKLSHPYAYALETLQLIDTKISHPMVSLSEALIYLDTAIRKPTYYLLDSTRVIDRKYKHAQVTVINIIAFIDEKYTSYTKVLSEAFPLIESRYAMANRYIIDSFKLSDSKLKHPLVYAHEVITPLEKRAMGFLRLEVITLEDSITRQFARYLSDIISTRDKIRKDVHKIRTEVTTFGDILSRGNISRVLTENAQLIDTKAYAITRHLTESIKHIDHRISRSMKYLSLEMTSIKESRIAHPSKMLTETMTGIEYYIRYVSAFRMERLKSIDVRKSTVVFVVSDLLKVSDQVVPRIRKMLSETVLGKDTRVQAVTKFFTDSVRASQRFVKHPELIKTELTNLSDVGVRIPKRVLTDALTVGDSLQRTLSTVVIEALHVVDRKRKEYSSTLVEHFHMGDTIRSFKSLFRRHGSNATQTTRVSLAKQTKKTTDVKQETTQKEIDEDAD